MQNSKKRILFILQDLELGGAEQLKFILSKYINKEKYDTIFCCINKIGTLGEKIQKQEGRVIFFGLEDKFYNLIATYKLYRLVKKLKPDLIHSSLFNANFHARLVGIFTKIPVVIEEHGMYAWKRWYHVVMDRWLTRFTYKIIVPSKSVKEFIIQQEGIDPSKIVVIYNCMDLCALKLNITRAEARKNLNLDEHDFVIGVVGNLRKEKGHSVLLRAFKDVISVHQNTKLLIAGYGPLDKELRIISRDLNLDKHVTFMGKVANILDFLISLDLFVMPSLSEGFGIALIEAVYMNIPCIASEVGGIKEIAEQFPEVSLMKPNDHEMLSKAILDSIKKRSEPDMRDIGSNKIKEIFTPLFYVNSIEDLYGNILNRDRSLNKSGE